MDGKEILASLLDLPTEIEIFLDIVEWLVASSSGPTSSAACLSVSVGRAGLFVHLKQRSDINKRSEVGRSVRFELTEM